jgi:hypothetical protein
LNHTRTIRLSIIIIAVATLMIAGTIFYPIIGKQQQAYSESDVRHKLRGDEQAVRSSLEQRNQNQQQQHMNQENLCLRATDKCSNSNVGEHSPSNDNSVTAFTDIWRSYMYRTKCCNFLSVPNDATNSITNSNSNSYTFSLCIKSIIDTN